MNSPCGRVFYIFMIPVNQYAMFCDVKAVLSSSVTLDFKTIVNLITVQFN